MRVLALDIGEVRVGIAVSDPAARVASPVTVLPAAEVLVHATTFRRVLEDWEPDLLVCGLPRTLAGEEGSTAPQAAAMLDMTTSALAADYPRHATSLLNLIKTSEETVRGIRK